MEKDYPQMNPNSSLEEKLEVLLKRQNLTSDDLPHLLSSFRNLGLQPNRLSKELRLATREGRFSPENPDTPQLARLFDLAHLLLFAIVTRKVD